MELSLIALDPYLQENFQDCDPKRANIFFFDLFEIFKGYSLGHEHRLFLSAGGWCAKGSDNGEKTVLSQIS